MPQKKRPIGPSAQQPEQQPVRPGTHWLQPVRLPWAKGSGPHQPPLPPPQLEQPVCTMASAGLPGAALASAVTTPPSGTGGAGGPASGAVWAAAAWAKARASKVDQAARLPPRTQPPRSGVFLITAPVLACRSDSPGRVRPQQ